MYVDSRFTAETILLLFGVFGVFGAEIPGCSGDPKKSCIKDYKLDILLMYDQSGSMSYTNYDEFRKASLEWVDAFFEIEGVNETQFAVIGCYSQEILHHFTDGNFKIEIPKAIGKIQFTPGGGDNLHKCSEKAVNEIFTPQGGDREEAKNIVLWISDCNFEEFDGNRESHLTQSKTLQVDKKADFFFVCCKYTTGSFALDRFMDKVMQWLKEGNKTGQSIIRYDYNNADLGKQAMDKVINVKEVDLVDCVVKNSSIIENCTYDRNFSKCMEKETYFIERHPYPTKKIGQLASKYGADCPKNVSRQCDGCEFPKDPQITAEEAAAAAAADRERKKWTIWLIVGIVGGLVLLLILLLLVAVFVVRRRRKQKMMKQEALGSTKQEKGKGIQADLTVMGGESKMKKTTMKQSMQPKKTAEQPNKTAEHPTKTATEPSKSASKKGGKMSKK